MIKYGIWYMRPEHFRDGIFGALPNPDLTMTHIHLMDLELVDEPPVGLQRMFAMFQGEVWSPNGEARELIESKGLRHTSMSVGDVILVNDEDTYVVASFGFKKVEGVS